MKAAGKKAAAAQKKAGKGIFATKALSADLAAICGKNKMARTDVTKAVWAYIKKKGLNKGRTINPDATLKTVVPVGSCAPFPSPSCLRVAGPSEACICKTDRCASGLPVSRGRKGHGNAPKLGRPNDPGNANGD